VEIVGRQRVQALTVDREDPRRQETSIERKQPRGVGQRRFDVAAPVTDDEGVAIKDLH
jgi:hypothetical protein